VSTFGGAESYITPDILSGGVVIRPWSFCQPTGGIVTRLRDDAVAVGHRR
jgi:hypothetical protein